MEFSTKGGWGGPTIFHNFPQIIFFKIAKIMSHRRLQSYPPFLSKSYSRYTTLQGVEYGIAGPYSLRLGVKFETILPRDRSSSGVWFQISHLAEMSMVVKITSASHELFLLAKSSRALAREDFAASYP